MDRAGFARLVANETKFDGGATGPKGFDITLIITLITTLAPLIMKMLENCKKKPEDAPAIAKSKLFFHKLKVKQAVKRHCKERGWAEGEYNAITDGLFVAASKTPKGDARAIIVG